MVLLLVIRWILARENRRRDREPKDTAYDDVFIGIMLADGTRVERKVEKVSEVAPQKDQSSLIHGVQPDRNTWISQTPRTATSDMYSRAGELDY